MDKVIKSLFFNCFNNRESHEKVNLTWNKDGTVTYRTIKRWYFDKEKTKGSLDDEVTSLNAVAAVGTILTFAPDRSEPYG